MKTHHLSRIAGAMVIALGLSTSVMATETSSTMTGKILSPTGAAAANTKIIITHIPSGTVKTITTNDSGTYTLRGLRVGGPYKVVVDSAEFKDQQFNNIFLEVGKPFRLSASLQPDDIEKITITGSRVVGFTNKGSAGSWGAEEIINAAGGNRDLKDILRSNPLVSVENDGDSSMSIAGSNPRYNSFTVDGVQQNDDFGLNGNGYPTQRSPISVDAIEQVSVEVTPYSVKNGGFSGGQVNAVTKSGTNEFHGTLSYEKTDSNWSGTPYKPSELGGGPVELDFESTTYAATLGGPIIKDKLFFFASYDNYDKPTQIEWGPDGSSAPNFTDINLADYQRVIDIAKSVYGVDAGTWDQQPQQTDEKILLKLDWNINDDHRAQLTYQNTQGNVTRNTSTSRRELKLSSHWYNKSEKLETLAAHLYSTWTDDFSTEVKVAYKKVDTGQIPGTRAFGDVTIFAESGDIALGADKYRHGNALTNNTLSMRFLGNYLYNDHELTFGAEYESIDVTNLFAPDSLGTWRFNSIDDFENGKASRLDYANAFTNNVADAEAKFTFNTFTLFAEDEYYITDDFLVSAGVRYERISSSDAPSANANFQQRYGFSNSVNLDGESILLPRVSFNWDFSEDIVIRGGVGRFSGGRPNVWLSNAYSNDGVTYVSARNERDFLDNADITKIPQGVLDAMVSGDGNVNVTDPNFKLPSDWRSSLAVDYTFGILDSEDWLWSAEFIYSKKENDVFWKDLTREVAGQTAAGQNIYRAVDKLTGETTRRYDIMLTNADKNGRSKIFTTSLSKYFDNGLGFNMSYTNQDVTEGTPGTSSTAKSNFKWPLTTDRGRAQVGTGTYQIEHSFKLNLNYRAEFIENYATKFNLFFERSSGRPISWVFESRNDTGFGDQGTFGWTSAYLPYIPTGADDPNIVLDGISWEELSANINAAGLGKYAGGFAPKGSGSSPWRTRMDLTITQELPGFMEGHKGELFFSIRNLLNMIDHNAAQSKRLRFGSKLFSGFDIDDQGRYVFTPLNRGFDGKNYDTFDADKSTWSIKAGVRYKF
ncbi:MAG: cell envelope biogenesis protein OmpA [Gammaproteobacteria bacterium]|nr:MAG: cell envelope biogenesis protein OmpA [Gammaproteobacteria bacterium]